MKQKACPRETLLRFKGYFSILYSMGIIEVFLTAIALSMDAFAVSICKGLKLREMEWSKAVLCGLWFGFFQALMPTIGYFAGKSFADSVADFDHWIVFVLLALIGGNMIRESREEDSDVDESFGVVNMLLLAIATSIDALAVGISFAFLSISIWSAVAIIGITTFLFSAAGVRIGNVFGLKYKSKAELAGGIILILIGLRVLIEHLSTGV